MEFIVWKAETNIIEEIKRSENRKYRFPRDFSDALYGAGFSKTERSFPFAFCFPEDLPVGWTVVDGAAIYIFLLDADRKKNTLSQKLFFTLWHSKTCFLAADLSINCIEHSAQQ
eukprot:gb/GEZJ01005703.1/.p1 GENE.gb/GEZJ01005703.1/~~gb/GEZJ01005703.1/.p1  ORF type:complete len:114 (+),score=16.83 gb/GEZJ01005703.1/:533-874(+)